MTNLLDFNTAKPIAQLEAERRGRSGVDAEDVHTRLAGSAQSFVEWLFSGRAHIHRHEARIGSVRGEAGSSLSIQLTGQAAGLWFDHASGEGGDLIDLYMATMGYAKGQNFQLALKEIAGGFLGDPVTVERSSWQPTPQQVIDERKRSMGTKPRADMLELGAPVATWKYLDTSGNIIASLVRYEPDGTPASKTYRPWHFKTIDGERKWTAGAPSLRPLYRLPEIVLATTVVLCEGEKCADALVKVGIEATSAMQGAEAPIEKTDWSPLSGKTVIVWPDNDAPGSAYGQRVASHLQAFGCRVSVVTVPAGKPPKWDAADFVAEGGDAQAIVAAAQPLVRTAAPRIRIVDIEDFADLPPPAWLIDGILTVNGLSVIWGRSGDMKSFVALDMALCVACGAPWHGKPTKAGPVLYIAAEGSYGLAKRALGWIKTRGEQFGRPRFKLIPHSLVMTSDDLGALITAIEALSERPVLIVIDTMARTFGAGDENKQADMNAYVVAADRLREATGANVAIVHHSGVAEDKRERGSNVLRGAADTVIKVKRTDDRIAIINQPPEGKQKDAEEFVTVHLRTQKVSYSHNDIEHTTLVLNLSEEQSEPEGFDGTLGNARVSPEGRLGRVEQQILDALKTAKQPLGFMRLIALTGASKGSISPSLKLLESRQLIESQLNETGVGNVWRLI